jgi:acyl carrier protein
MSHSSTSKRLSSLIEAFLKGDERDCARIAPTTKLVRDIGLTSDDGVLLVLDICKEFRIDLPDDFNAVVHDNGRRDRTFGELVALLERAIAEKEAVA